MPISRNNRYSSIIFFEKKGQKEKKRGEMYLLTIQRDGKISYFKVTLIFGSFDLNT